MARHRKLGKQKKDYAVGYGRPPPEQRFKKGQSGNPRGRPKGTQSLGSFLNEALSRRVTVTENGKPRRMRVQDIIIQGIINDAARRDPRAVRLLFALMDRYQDSTEAQVEAADLSAEDQAIIQRYVSSRQTSDKAGATPPAPGRRKRKHLSQN